MEYGQDAENACQKVSLDLKMHAPIYAHVCIYVKTILNQIKSERIPPQQTFISRNIIHERQN